MEQEVFKCVLTVEWSMEFCSLCTSPMEYRGLQFGLPDEWNRKFFRLAYRPNGTERSLLWGTGGIEQGDFSLGDRSNGTVRSLEWGAGGMEE